MERRGLRRVMIGTPTYDGKVDIRYVDSLLPSIELGAKLNMQIAPVYIGYNALIQQSRNDLFQIAHSLDVDDLIMIDADIGWKAEDIIRLLNHPVHIVGGTYRRKTDTTLSYVARIKDDIGKIEIKEDGLAEVGGLGMGFCRFDNYAIKKLWNNSSKYIENGTEKRMIFNVTIKEEMIFSEDVSLCYFWISLKERIYLDTKITCSHTGMKCFEGDFSEWIKRYKMNRAEESVKSGRKNKR